MCVCVRTRSHVCMCVCMHACVRVCVWCVCTRMCEAMSMPQGTHGGLRTSFQESVLSSLLVFEAHSLPPPPWRSGRAEVTVLRHKIQFSRVGSN